MERLSTLGVARDWRRKEWGATAYGYDVSSWDDENILELDRGYSCTTL